MLLHQQIFIVITKVQHVFIFSPFFLVTHHISQEKDLIKNSNLEYNMEWIVVILSFFNPPSFQD
jgi:hypothetical protein